MEINSTNYLFDNELELNWIGFISSMLNSNHLVKFGNLKWINQLKWKRFNHWKFQHFVNWSELQLIERIGTLKHRFENGAISTALVGYAFRPQDSRFLKRIRHWNGTLIWQYQAFRDIYCWHFTPFFTTSYKVKPLNAFHLRAWLVSQLV